MRDPLKHPFLNPDTGSVRRGIPISAGTPAVMAEILPADPTRTAVAFRLVGAGRALIRPGPAGGGAVPIPLLATDGYLKFETPAWDGVVQGPWFGQVTAVPAEIIILGNTRNPQA